MTTCQQTHACEIADASSDVSLRRVTCDGCGVLVNAVLPSTAAAIAAEHEATKAPEPVQTFEKVTICPPSDDVPFVGRVANGGVTTTDRADSPNVARLLEQGYRVLRRWRVVWNPAIAGRAGYSSTELPVGPTAAHGWTFEKALHHARCYVPTTVGRPTYVTHAEIASTMIDLDCCTWHGAFVAFSRAYDDGRIPTDVCSLCGGRNLAGLGDHALCTVRAERGGETPKLDVVDAMICSCHDCQKAQS